LKQTILNAIKPFLTNNKPINGMPVKKKDVRTYKFMPRY
jgi:hypothetical protein